ncbi:MAG: PIN domain-containing protein [Actinomycetota bacterium]
MAEETLTFVDTNVLIYAHDRSEVAKQPVAAAMLESLWESRTGTLSTQVLQEFYVVVTRKVDPPMSHVDARAIVAAYGEWQVVHVDVPMIVASSRLEQRHQLPFWDALIVEAARRAGAHRLLSEDLQSGRRIAGVKIENPFC